MRRSDLPAAASVRTGRRSWHRCWLKSYARWSPWSHQGATVVNSLDRDRLYAAVPHELPRPAHLESLLDLLARAVAVAPQHVPPDLVTMNSVVRLRPCGGGESETVHLVYPHDADRAPLGRSVAAPCGAALFGRREGDAVVWPTHRGERRAVVEAIEYQPEREGHYDR